MSSKFIIVVFLILSRPGVAATSPDAALWNGLYRSSDGEIMRITGTGRYILLETFVLKDARWHKMTDWATTLKESRYAEFRQRAEPNGLWLSLTLQNGRITETSHSGTDYHSPKRRVVYTKLSDPDAKLTPALPDGNNMRE